MQSSFEWLLSRAGHEKPCLNPPGPSGKGSFLLRFDTRAFLGLLFQDPPRSASALFPSFESRKKNRRRLRRRFNELRLGCSVSKRKKKKRAKGIYSRAHRSPIPS